MRTRRDRKRLRQTRRRDGNEDHDLSLLEEVERAASGNRDCIRLYERGLYRVQTCGTKLIARWRTTVNTPQPLYEESLTSS